jgi:hypothetical protein
MPKEGAMAQLSRPYQIGLAAVALLAAAWLLLMQGHSNSPSTPAQSATSTPTTHVVKAKAVQPKVSTANHGGEATGGSHIYHGAAPGIEGLSKDIAKAHGAVSTSERNAKTLEEKSAQASSPTVTGSSSTPTSGSHASSQTSGSAAAGASTHASTAPSTSKTAPKTAPKTATTTAATTTSKAKAQPSQGASSTSSSSMPARQRAVETALAHGQIALILFWNPKAADDVAVHQAVAQVRGHHGLHVSVQEASSGEVADFGTITRGVQIYGTPTLLVVNKSGQVRMLTGVQGSYAIEQAIQEAREGLHT